MQIRTILWAMLAAGVLASCATEPGPVAEPPDVAYQRCEDGSLVEPWESCPAQTVEAERKSAEDLAAARRAEERRAAEAQRRSSDRGDYELADELPDPVGPDYDEPAPAAGAPAPDAPDAAPRPQMSQCETCTEISVLFGTNREIEFGLDMESVNIIQRERVVANTNNARILKLGDAVISVPRLSGDDEGAGSIRRGGSFMGFRTRELDPERDFVALDYGPLSEFLFRSKLMTADSVFVFVHGFNVSFKNALFRAAQLKTDSGFEGQAMLFSWPTKQAGVLPRRAYLESRQQAEDSYRYLREYLDIIRETADGRPVHLIAHSMGSYVTIEALQDLHADLVRNGELEDPVFGQLIFAAPDVLREDFEDFVRDTEGLAEGITLYASAKDWSMRISREFCESNTGASCGTRAGDVNENGPLVVRGDMLDTLDVSNLPNGFLDPLAEHNYFGGDQLMLNDIGLLLATGQRAPRTPDWLERPARRGVYWQLPDRR